MSFKSGTDIDSLSKKYSCTNLTIIRNLKKNLGELKYKDFINKSKSLKEKPETNKHQTNDHPETNFDKQDSKTDFKNSKVLNEKISDSNIASNDYFLEIARQIVFLTAFFALEYFWEMILD